MPKAKGGSDWFDSLDAVNVTWPNGEGSPPLRIVRVVERDGYAQRSSGYDVGTDTRFVRFRNAGADHAPEAYDLLWEWIG